MNTGGRVWNGTGREVLFARWVCEAAVEARASYTVKLSSFYLPSSIKSKIGTGTYIRHLI